MTTPQPIAHFIVRCPIDRTPDLAKAIQEAHIEFSLTGNQFYLNKEYLLDGIMTGLEAPEFIKQLNLRIENSGSPLRINVPFEEMTPLEQHNILVLVNTQAVWKSEYTPELEYIAPADLDGFVTENPRIITNVETEQE